MVLKKVVLFAQEQEGTRGKLASTEGKSSRLFPPFPSPDETGLYLLLTYRHVCIQKGLLINS